MSAPAMPGLPDVCWPVDEDALPSTWADVDPDVQDRAKAIATSTLHRLTLGRVGGCPVQVFPCVTGALGASPWLVYGYGWMWGDGQPFFPYIAQGGVWVNCGCLPMSGCGCETGCQIKGLGLVGRLDAVRVNGTDIDLSLVKVDNGDTITYVGPDACPWPRRQDMSKPADQRALAVTYLPAHEVDGWGAYVAGVLALEFAIAMTNPAGSKCRLPAGVTAVVRQGVTMTITPGSFPNGFTGIREVDTYIAHWNPGGWQSAPAVWTPDIERARGRV